MFNVEMTEIFCFAVIALVILGPEQLPEAARFIAKWYGKFKRAITTIQQEIDQELKLSEFREEIQQEIQRLTELERRLQQQLDEQRELREQRYEQSDIPQPAKLNFMAYQYTRQHYSPPFLRPCADCLCTESNNTIVPHFKIAV